MARKPRAAAQAAAQSLKNAPSIPDPDDEEMVEAPASPEPSPVEESRDDASEKDPDAEPQPEESEQPQEEEAPEAGTPATTAAEAAAAAADTPGQDVNSPSRPDSPAHMGPGRPSAIPRKRRIGRPPKNRPPDWDAPDDSVAQSPNHVGTPAKRRRGRPTASGGRWARNRGPWHVTQVPVDKDGKPMEIANDEVVLPEDPEGETKVDKNGNLQDGREYRVRTFTIVNRDRDRKYMLSTEPARCIGFRDSYLFFQKHRMLYKIIIDDEAKRDLIDRDIIPHSYKGRAIGVVTARSVFREFGARIVVGGKKVTDEYYAQAARERGEVEGEVAVPEDRLPGPGEVYNRNQYVAWHGASSVYHTAGPSVPLPTGKVVDSKKRKITVTGDNWMLEHAREASMYNSLISVGRRAQLGGSYDIHTNVMQYPKIMQPTHARWERVPPPDPRVASRLAQGLSSLSLTNDEDESAPLANEDPDSEPQPDKPSATTAPDDTDTDNNPTEDATKPDTGNQPTTTTTVSPFPTVPAPLSRRFAIHDIYYETPPSSNLGIPGPDGDVHDLGANGLLSTANPRYPEFVGPEILAELPPECKEALLESAAREWEWKSRWGSEGVDAARAKPLKSYAWFP